MLDVMPIIGNTYDQIFDLFDSDPVEEATAAPARLPMDVFCKIIGRHPRTVGTRKSLKNRTFVAAKA